MTKYAKETLGPRHIAAILISLIKSIQRKTKNYICIQNSTVNFTDICLALFF